MRTTQRLSGLILLLFICLIGNVNAQQRKNFIIAECKVEKNVSAFRNSFSESESYYVNEIVDLFIGENIQVTRLEPVITSYKSSDLPNYKFNLLGYTFTLQYVPYKRNYTRFKSSEFYLSQMYWYKAEPQRFKSNFVLNVKETHEELGPIVITLMAVLDTGY